MIEGRGRWPVVLALLLAACGWDTPTRPPDPTGPVDTAPQWTASIAPGYEGMTRAVYLAEGPAASGSDFSVELHVAEVPTHLQLFFDLTFPSEVVSYAFIEMGNVSGSFGPVGGQPGILRAHLTPLQRSAHLLTIHFTVEAAGVGSFEFVGQGTSNTTTGQVRWGNLSWFGAALETARQ